MRFILIFLVTLFHLSSSAQVWNKTKHDFGKVKSWNSPPAYYIITNDTKQPFTFLPISYNVRLQVSIPVQTLKPGEKTVVEVRYYTDKYGRFGFDFPIFISTQRQPLLLSINGDIASFHPNAYNVCPRIDDREANVSQQQFTHQMEVIDAQTGQPITDYKLTLKTRYSSENFRSKHSQLSIQRQKPELAIIKVTKEGYAPYTAEEYINRNTGGTLVQLTPLPKTSEPVASVTPPIENSRKPTPEPKSNPKLDLRTTLKNRKIETPKEDQETEVVAQEKEEDYFDFKKKETEPKEPAVVKSPRPTSKPVTPTTPTAQVSKDTAVFTSDGKLNTLRFANNHLIFVIDISASMDKPNKLPLLKYSMLQLIAVLRADDKVTIITYHSEIDVLAEAISGANKSVLEETINGLKAKGQSYGQEALDVAYEKANRHFINNGNNEIILVSDGLFNTPNFKEKNIYRRVKRGYDKEQIRFSSIAFGKNPNAKEFMEMMAANGKGNYMLVVDENAVDRALVNTVMMHSEIKK